MNQELTSRQALDLGYKYLLPYSTLQWPGYQIGKHHALIAKHLEAVEDGTIDRLMIFMPPRSGKTMLSSENFVPWYLGRNPTKQVIYATYSHDRAGDVGQKVRNNLLDPVHQKIFPGCELSSDSKGKNKFTTTKGGIGIFTGIDSGVTGRGAHCLTGEMEVLTEHGSLKIKNLFDMDFPPAVFSLNVRTGKIELMPLIAGQKSIAKEIYEIKTDSGNYIRATGQHRFFVSGQGYKQAKDLRRGDQLVKLKEEQNLCSLWQEERWQGPYVPSLLSRNKKNRHSCNMSILWKDNHKKGLRNSQGDQARTKRSLLFPGMFKSSSCSQKSSKMRNLWNPDTKKDNAFLFGRVQSDQSRKTQDIKTNSLRTLRSGIQAPQFEVKVLLPKMPGRVAFDPDEWQGQFKLQARQKLCKAIRSNTPINFRSRQKMCGLWPRTCLPYSGVVRQKNQSYQSGVPSYRWRSNKQLSGKYDNFVQDLPHNTSQVECDTISSIKRYCDKEHYVYDIQVAKNYNFFVNHALTHNCLLIDDPIKGQKDAESETAQRHLRDWFSTVAYTRLMDTNAIIVILTRWHHNDLAGWLLREKAHEGWRVLSLPAIADENNDILGRKYGEALWPEKYPIERLLRTKQTLSTRQWSALYQQKPVTDDGGLVNLDWFGRFELNSKEWRAFLVAKRMGNKKIKPPYGIKRIVHSWDTAFKESQINDPSACTIWGVAKNGFYLLGVINDHMAYPKLRRTVEETWEQWSLPGMPPVTVIIEDKASGQSLIQDLKANTMIPVIPIKADASKVIRFSECTGIIEAGRVNLPKDAPWLTDYETQLIEFPLGKNDDLVDSTSQFLRWGGKPRRVRSKKPLYWK